METSTVIAEFIQRHVLPEDYARIAQTWFVPVIDRIVQCRAGSEQPIVVGINGSQGSGKSTLADLMVSVLQQAHGLRALSLSIDDFYLTRKERRQLANTVHPLLQTRGVPGTHDVELACRVLAGLECFTQAVAVPRFDKSRDDRYPEANHDSITQAVDIIILEGWCVGSVAQDSGALADAINTLEAEEDIDGTWRNYVNLQLRDHYPRLFAFVDIWVMLKAPSFDCVFNWRLEQEEKLGKSLGSKQSGSAEPGTGAAKQQSTVLMDRDAIARFIQHYQRITEHTLSTLPANVHFLFELDSSREIEKLSMPVELEC